MIAESVIRKSRTLLRENIVDLLTAVDSLLAANESLMPGLKHISVEDYMLINDAPIQARQAVAVIRRRLKLR